MTMNPYGPSGRAPNIARGDVPTINVGFRPLPHGSAVNVNAPNVQPSPMQNQPSAQPAAPSSAPQTPQGFTTEGGWDRGGDGNEHSPVHATSGPFAQLGNAIGNVTGQGNTIGGLSTQGGYSGGGYNQGIGIPGVATIGGGFGGTPGTHGAQSSFGGMGTAGLSGPNAMAGTPGQLGGYGSAAGTVAGLALGVPGLGMLGSALDQPGQATNVANIGGVDTVVSEGSFAPGLSQTGVDFSGGPGTGANLGINPETGSAVAIGYAPGQVDPALAEAAGYTETGEGMEPGDAGYDIAEAHALGSHGFNPEQHAGTATGQSVMGLGYSPSGAAPAGSQHSSTGVFSTGGGGGTAGGGGGVSTGGSGSNTGHAATDAANEAAASGGGGNGGGGK